MSIFIHSYSSELFSLSDAISAVLNSAKRVAVMPLSQITMSQTDVFFLIKNIPGMFNYINQSSWEIVRIK